MFKSFSLLLGQASILSRTQQNGPNFEVRNSIVGDPCTANVYKAASGIMSLCPSAQLFWQTELDFALELAIVPTQHGTSSDR
jgi:hypothetical protein